MKINIIDLLNLSPDTLKNARDPYVQMNLFDLQYFYKKLLIKKLNFFK